MEQERDCIDELLFDAFEEIELDGRFGDQYNKRLIEKLHGEVKPIRRTRTAAISLITAGILLGFMYTSGVQYGMANFQCKIKANFVIMKQSMNLDKYFFGE